MEFKLPDIGEGVQEGEVVKWLVKPGDSIAVDQPLIEIMTDKATVEIPSPFAGKITATMAKEGEMIKVGQVIVTYEGSGTSAPKPAPTAAPKAATPTPVFAAKTATPAASKPAPAPAPAQPHSSVQYTASPGQVLATPATRRLARDLGVDLTQVPATGPNGRVTKEDLQRFAGASAAGPQRPVQGGTPVSTPARTPSGGEVLIPFRGIRRKIAEAMSKSRTIIPEFTYVDECDVTELVLFRKEVKDSAEKQGVKITFLPFIIKAMIKGLKLYPQLNSTLDEAGGNIIQKHYFNIGIAVDTDEGLMVPVIKNADTKSILEIAAEIQTLAEKARTRKLAAQDMQGATITITNPGPIGGMITAPVINYPEVAIMGVHKIVKRPVVKNDQIAIADMIYLSLAVDHRVVDGATAARFMNVVIDYLSNPKKLMLEMA